MNCGYTGQRTAAANHLTAIHNVEPRRALDMLKSRTCPRAPEYEYLPNPEKLRLYPLVARKLGLIPEE